MVVSTAPGIFMISTFLSLHDFWSFLLVYYSINLAAAILALSLTNVFFAKSSRLVQWILLIEIQLAILPFVLLYDYQPRLFVGTFMCSLITLHVAKAIFRNHSYSGLNFYIANFGTIIIALVWGASFIIALPVSVTTKLFLSASVPLLFITVPSSLLQLFELYETVCRERWSRPKKRFPRRAPNLAGREPFVSIHVPTHAEPPEMVIETLKKIAQLDYKNYEVIVLDNNTEDEKLWKPVAAFCAKLGHNFRFIHVEDMHGAKGGALNFALEITDPRATLVAVIDADYHTDVDFLSALVGHFDNPLIGFVQTPHDYRDWQHSLYLTLCYWEYKLFFHAVAIARCDVNEIDAGITVGTMCIIRKAALQKAGGWSETCVTEDSELAIRIHDAGYSSIYVDTPHGYGLIPDTFTAYKKQRYRWTAGPVQEFRIHLTRYLSLHPDRVMTPVQRIFHLNHGLNNVVLGFTIPLSLLGIGVIVSMIMHNEIIAVPFELWLAATVLLATNPLLNWLMFKLRLSSGFKQYLAFLFASRALGHVIYYSAFRTLLTGNAQWVRTDKFKSEPSYRAALYNTKDEIMLGCILLLFILAACIAMPYTGLALMFIIGLSYVCINYFAAPALSLLSVFSLKRSDRGVEV